MGLKKLAILGAAVALAGAPVGWWVTGAGADAAVTPERSELGLQQFADFDLDAVGVEAVEAEPTVAEQRPALAEVAVAQGLEVPEAPVAQQTAEETAPAAAGEPAIVDDELRALVAEDAARSSEGRTVAMQAAQDDVDDALAPPPGAQPAPAPATNTNTGVNWGAVGVGAGVGALAGFGAGFGIGYAVGDDRKDIRGKVAIVSPADL